MSIGTQSVKVTAPTAGTAVSLGSIKSPSVQIQAVAGGGSLYLGGSNVSATNGMPISTTVPFKLENLMTDGHTEDYDFSKMYIVGTSTNDAVIVLYAVR